ncbi:hypothetical protein EJ03DRAFT_318915 [Teratosphaeria nubilosa]|uniref:MFS general substrate transporter n=1 Tax=Teratosphaeria nubilosa TaxID=161662 RepID=A0A6G1KYP4_9PEZI|nr:hypothetical protein EJ03DRAFT_318915 [Teratosphaeria nubilosa]
MAMLKGRMPKLRYHGPYVQNFICGICVGFSAGIYVALNLLGAGGGRASSAQMTQIVNATLCSVWFFSASFGGSILNLLGPGITMCIGVLCYVVYVGALWYFDTVGQLGYPIASGVIIGIGAGMVFVTSGYIQTSYPEEREKGRYITTQLNLEALGSVIGGIIPVIINRNSATTAGVPHSVYISFISIMTCAGFSALLLLPPHKLRRDDGSIVAVDKARGPWEEFRANLLVFTDWKLLLMVPAFLPAECFLVFTGSVNSYHNDLRARCLLAFMAQLLQIPCGLGLQVILDHKAWSRRKRGLIGLTAVVVPLVAAWIWQFIRVRDYKRHQTRTNPTDWSDGEFGWIFVLFMLTSISCNLWHYVVTYYIGALTNSPVKLAHYMGVFRGFMGAGEAICFGIDSLKIPFIDEAGGIFAFFLAGIIAFYYLGWFHIDDSNYFKDGEVGAIVPNHILQEKGMEGQPEEIFRAGSTKGVDDEVAAKA